MMIQQVCCATFICNDKTPSVFRRSRDVNLPASVIIIKSLFRLLDQINVHMCSDLRKFENHRRSSGTSEGQRKHKLEFFFFQMVCCETLVCREKPEVCSQSVKLKIFVKKLQLIFAYLCDKYPPGREPTAI